MKNLKRKPSGKFNTYQLIDDGYTVAASSVYIMKVIYQYPATIVFWSDNTKTIAKCHEDDEYSPEVGLMTCIFKKLYGSAGLHDLINDWAPTQGNIVTLKHVRQKCKVRK